MNQYEPMSPIPTPANSPGPAVPPADTHAGLRTEAARCPVCLRVPREAHARGRDFEYGATGSAEWSFVRCSGCDVILLSPRPVDEDIARLYPADYYAHAAGAPTVGQRVKVLLDRRAARAYLRAAGPDAPHRPLLDLGCGDGRLLSLFEDVGVSRALLHGVEISERAAAAARARGYDVRAGRLESLDLPAERFGLVVMQQVLEHVADPRAVLSQIFCALAPGGALIIETPSTASLDHFLFRGRHWGGYHIPRHLVLFSPRSARRLLACAGFEVVRVEPLLSPSFWIQSLHHLLLERGAPAPVLRFLDPHRPGPLPLAAFSALDLLGKSVGVTSNMRVIARKR